MSINIPHYVSLILASFSPPPHLSSVPPTAPPAPLV